MSAISSAVDPDKMEEIMNDPQYEGMIEEMMNDPDTMRHLINENPALRSMMNGNPMMKAIMENPALMKMKMIQPGPSTASPDLGTNPFLQNSLLANSLAVNRPAGFGQSALGQPNPFANFGGMNPLLGNPMFTNPEFIARAERMRDEFSLQGLPPDIKLTFISILEFFEVSGGEGVEYRITIINFIGKRAGIGCSHEEDGHHDEYGLDERIASQLLLWKAFKDGGSEMHDVKEERNAEDVA
ncbi:unnamed protein product [Sphagnum balticum]